MHNKKQYTSNDYVILCDKEYNEFKWFLLKKKIKEDAQEGESEKEEQLEKSYDNLIWVPIIDIVDLDNFNYYSNEEEEKKIILKCLIYLKN